MARQCCGQLGKRANCQALVSLTLAGAEVPIPLSLRLFLPRDNQAESAHCLANNALGSELIASPEMLHRMGTGGDGDGTDQHVDTR